MWREIKREKGKECTNLHINPYDEMCVQSAVYMGFSFEIHRNFTRWLQSICSMYVYVLRIFRRYLKTSLGTSLLLLSSVFNGRLSIELKWQLMHSSGTNTVHRPLFLPSAFAHNEIYLLHAHAFTAIQEPFIDDSNPKRISLKSTLILIMEYRFISAGSYMFAQ